MADLTTLTDEELAALSADVGNELARRYELAAIPAKMTELNATYLDAEGVTSGDPWRQPTGAHDAYPIDWVVTHNDATWVSLHDANVYEPGVSGWREVVEPGEYPAWVQPTGAHDAYPAGAEVAHNELLWRSDVGDNVWEPGVYGWTEFTNQEA